MKILVVKINRSTIYYEADTDEALHKISCRLLRDFCDIKQDKVISLKEECGLDENEIKSLPDGMLKETGLNLIKNKRQEVLNQVFSGQVCQALIIPYDTNAPYIDRMRPYNLLLGRIGKEFFDVSLEETTKIV